MFLNGTVDTVLTFRYAFERRNLLDQVLQLKAEQAFLLGSWIKINSHKTLEIFHHVTETKKGFFGVSATSSIEAINLQVDYQLKGTSNFFSKLVR